MRTNFALYDQVGTAKYANRDTKTVSTPSRMKILVWQESALERLIYFGLLHHCHPLRPPTPSIFAIAYAKIPVRDGS